MTFDPLDVQPRKYPRQARSRATYEAILDATARILAKDGYDKLNTNAIAECAGVSIGTLYEYFYQRESIVALLIVREAERVADALEASMIALQGLPLEVAMRRWLEAMFVELEERKGFVRELLVGIPFVSQLPIAEAFPAELVKIAQRGGVIRRNELNIDGMNGAYFLLTNMIQGAFLAMLLNPPHYVSRHQMLDNLTVFALRMIRGESSKTI